MGVQPFWFWNDQPFEVRESVKIPTNTVIESKPARVTYRGWFINDETLLSHWKVERRADLPFIMAFETLLRLGGNMVIPGTGKNAHIYRQAAADMGLIITHHHAEPLGAEMFAQAYPDLEPMYSKYPEKFRALWQAGIDAQKGMRVIWNIGFRGQGDKPFWDDDPKYDTPEKRGELMSALIKQQYDLVKDNDPNAVCCTNLYGETMELYKDGFLKLPDDIIKIWADNGYGKMVSRRQGNANPRVPALPQQGDDDAHGIYYHASFYDLQAASHITMLPNSTEFVSQELTDVLIHGADDYWLINCSNIKPHAFLLDLIARCWRDGTVDAVQQSIAYMVAYYGLLHRSDVAQCLTDYAQFTVPYGPNEDDRAGDQFYNHVPRMLISQFVKDRTSPADDLRWLFDVPTLAEQSTHCAEIFQKAAENYAVYLRQCEKTAAELAEERFLQNAAGTAGMMELPTPFRFTSVYSFFPIWHVGRPRFCQIPHISQFETAQVQCACAAVGEPQFLFAIQLQSAHRSLPGIAGSYREYKGRGTAFLCGNFQRTIASAAIGNCKIGTGMQQKAAIARVGAIAQVGNILLGKNIAVRAILSDVGVLFADGGFGAVGAGTVGGLQATGNARGVAVSDFQRAIVQPAGSDPHLGNAAIRQKRNLFGTALAGIGRAVGLAVVEHIPLTVDLHNTAMVGTGIIAGHRAAIQPNIAVGNNGSAVMVNALGLIRHSIAQFVILGGRIDQIITAIRFAQGRCFKKRVLRKIGSLSIRLLG